MQYGGEGRVHADYGRRVLCVGGGDRKVDGTGDANGEGAGRGCIGWEFSLAYPDRSVRVNVPGGAFWSQ